MIIKYLQNKHFLIEETEPKLTVNINPESFQTDSINIFTKETTTPSKDLVALDLPGEYEVNNCFVKGLAAGQYTIFNLQFDDKSIGIITDFNDKELSSKQTEKLGETDYLVLNLSTDLTLETAKNIIEQTECKVIIIAGDQAETDKINGSFSDLNQTEEYKFTAADLNTDSVKIILLNQNN